MWVDNIQFMCIARKFSETSIAGGRETLLQLFLWIVSIDAAAALQISSITKATCVIELHPASDGGCWCAACHNDGALFCISI